DCDGKQKRPEGGDHRLSESADKLRDGSTTKFGEFLDLPSARFHRWADRLAYTMRFPDDSTYCFVFHQGNFKQIKRKARRDYLRIFHPVDFCAIKRSVPHHRRNRG